MVFNCFSCFFPQVIGDDTNPGPRAPPSPPGVAGPSPPDAAATTTSRAATSPPGATATPTSRAPPGAAATPTPRASPSPLAAAAASTSITGPFPSRAPPFTSRAVPSPPGASSPSTSRAAPSTSITGPSTSRAAPSPLAAAAASTSITGPFPSRAPPFTSRAVPSPPGASAPSTSRAAPSTSITGPSTSRAAPSPPGAAAPSTSITGPSTSYAAETGRVDSIHDPHFEGVSSSYSQNMRIFSFKELQDATSNFTSECLGEGGFGKVYKGYFVQEEQEVAIKELNNKGDQGTPEFTNELEVLKNVNHQNLVKLFGFCDEDPHFLLVYEYMELGSLDHHLFDLSIDKQPLNWNTRIKIAIDVATGLNYLHNEYHPSIVHRDLKSSNVLLGMGYHAKLSDFGVARVVPSGDNHVETRVIGSSGYIAPEYFRTGLLTLKSDIFSFGVVLFELITGRKAFDPRKPSPEDYLVKWVRPIATRNHMWRLADPLLPEEQDSKKNIRRAIVIGLSCIQQNPKERPSSIADVLKGLQKCLPVN